MYSQNQTIAVVVPSYNYEKYIAEALNSVYEQTHLNIELIVVDDCSSDSSLQILNELLNSAKYQERFNRIKLIVHDINKGAHFSINEGIQNSDAPLITILNADDLYEPKRLELLLKSLLEKNGEFAFSAVKVIDADNHLLDSNNELARTFIDLQQKIFQFPTIGWGLIPHNIAISTGNFLFSRDLFNNVEGFRNFKYCHDWDFILRALLLTEPIFVEETSYLYRLHGNNTFLKLNNVVDREVKLILGNYFLQTRLRKPKNMKAPSLTYWSNEYYTYLNQTSMMHFWKYSKTLRNYFNLLIFYLFTKNKE